MKSKLAALFAAAVLPFAVTACGGTDLAADTAQDDLARSVEPMAWHAAALSAASTVVGHPYLVQVEGDANSAGTLVWTFTFWGDVWGWTTVHVSSAGAKVLEHGHMVDTPMGARAIDVSKVKVSLAQAKDIAAKNGCTGKITHVELTEVLAQSSNPHWLLEAGNQSVAVDAATGSKVQ